MINCQKIVSVDIFTSFEDRLFPALDRVFNPSERKETGKKDGKPVFEYVKTPIDANRRKQVIREIESIFGVELQTKLSEIPTLLAELREREPDKRGKKGSFVASPERRVELAASQGGRGDEYPLTGIVDKEMV